MATAKAGFIALRTNLKVDEKVKLIFEHNEMIAKVVQVNENGFFVDQLQDGDVFVYGRQVEDFRTIDYEAIAMLNVSATQESLKRIRELERQNRELKATCNDLLLLKSELEILKKNVSLLMNQSSTASTDK
jgi:hypothetical protein